MDLRELRFGVEIETVQKENPSERRNLKPLTGHRNGSNSRPAR